eukprot:GHVU01174587.1.p1 GENE.GHVU01174587.1~~GHVU01174587.1.p1  ORF type:complete len:147 (+),score=6.77 GHVU01174587.1:174-614(+)
MRKLKQFSVNKDALVQFYEAKIRPVITYAAPAWYGFTDQGTRQYLEGVQKMATKIIMPEVDSYTKRCESLNLVPLTCYLEQSCDNYFNKILTDHEHTIHKKLNKATSRRSARGKNNQLQLELCRTEKRKRSFLVAGIYKNVMPQKL